VTVAFYQQQQKKTYAIAVFVPEGKVSAEGVWFAALKDDPHVDIGLPSPAEVPGKVVLGTQSNNT
jgi:hypothetical protein